MQAGCARARDRRTRADTGGHGCTRTDVGGDNGEVGKEVGGEKPLHGAMVRVFVVRLWIVRPRSR